MKHELWRDEDKAIGYMFCLAGPMGDQVRASLPENAELILTVEADSYFEAMTKYYEFMGWGNTKYRPIGKMPKIPTRRSGSKPKRTGAINLCEY